MASWTYQRITAPTDTYLPTEMNTQNYLNSTAVDTVHPMFVKCARAYPTFNDWNADNHMYVFHSNGTVAAGELIPWNTTQTDFTWTSLRVTSPDEVVNLLNGLSLAQQFFARITATCTDHSDTATIYYLVLWPEEQ